MQERSVANLSETYIITKEIADFMKSRKENPLVFTRQFGKNINNWNQLEVIFDWFIGPDAETAKMKNKN